MAGKFITFMVVPDDDREPKRYRLPLWLYHTFLILLVVIIVAPLFYIVFYYDIIEKAAEAGRLSEENESLRRYQYKVQVLEQSLLETQRVMADISALAGLDSVILAGLYAESDTGAAGRPVLHGVMRALPPSSPIPDGLPAMGWISRGYSDIPGKHHHGVDLALPEGSPVYAAYGIVTSAGFDETFGETVILQNDDSIETVFGHNSRLVVETGDTVYGGQRIALSGNTGVSSAPHLHYEIRINGKAVNPIKYFIHEEQAR